MLVPLALNVFTIFSISAAVGIAALAGSISKTACTEEFKFLLAPVEIPLVAVLSTLSAFIRFKAPSALAVSLRITTLSELTIRSGWLKIPLRAIPISEAAASPPILVKVMLLTSSNPSTAKASTLPTVSKPELV